MHSRMHEVYVRVCVWTHSRKSSKEQDGQTTAHTCVRIHTDRQTLTQSLTHHAWWEESPTQAQWPPPLHSLISQCRKHHRSHVYTQHHTNKLTASSGPVSQIFSVCLCLSVSRLSSFLGGVFVAFVEDGLVVLGLAAQGP
mmetsp:Transcript_47305/g.118121  ORF Transcript_47305/g.118121 Transcript_47305/m.118121 type:complete len:140 (-) Transcript_47305:341-760(-)